MPEPAPLSTSTRWRCATISRTLAGVSPTRYSWSLISFGTPISIANAPAVARCAAFSHADHAVVGAVAIERPERDRRDTIFHQRSTCTKRVLLLVLPAAVEPPNV